MGATVCVRCTARVIVVVANNPLNKLQAKLA
jgi:hypothetical protein